MTTDWKSWWQRRVSHGQPEKAPPTATQQSSYVGAGPGHLPQCPPGYAWMLHPQMGPVMVPITGAPAVTMQAPLPPPQGATPYFAPPAQQHAPGRVLQFPTSPSTPTRTNMLVKPGNRDTYAEFLDTLPDMVPPSNYDAMAGNPNPEVARELGSLQEYNFLGSGATPGTPSVAFPETGRGVPVAQANDLRTAPAPVAVANNDE